MDAVLSQNTLQERLRLILPTPIAIVGFGLEGQSTLAFLQKHGFTDDELMIFDQNPVQLETPVRSFHGEDYLSHLHQAETAVRSAGFPPRLLAHFEGAWTSQVELFFELYQQKFVAITGTFGKGTTLGILESILKSAERPYALGGNYGIPVLNLIDEIQPEQIPLLELSSFQTMTLTRSAPIAAVLSTTVEHLDWHADVEEYRMAKAQLVKFQNPNDLCVYAAPSPGAQEIAAHSRARKIAAGAEAGLFSVQGESLQLADGLLHLQDCASRGVHMLHNMAVAAALATELGVAAEAIRAGLKAFGGLPLRLEFSAKTDRLSYYNDSYATRPEAALAAARSFGEALGMILGGSEKNVDFTELCQGLKEHPSLMQICLIGQTAARLRETLAKVGFDRPVVDAPDLESAVQYLEEILPPGGVVLLSPACASFGMFKNYKHRGEVFHQIARSRT